MSARDELFLHLPDSLWLSKRDALIDAFREEVIAEVAVADGRVLASVGPAAQRDADRIGELERELAECRAGRDAAAREMREAFERAMAEPRSRVLAEVVAWLEKKAREYGGGNARQQVEAETCWRIADKIRRGAVRPTEAAGS